MATLSGSLSRKWMKPRLTGLAAAGMIVLTGWSPASAQDVSHLNQDMDNRPNLQSEQTVSGHTSAPGVNAQQPLSPPRSSPGRHPVKASKSSPRLHAASPSTSTGQRASLGPQ